MEVELLERITAELAEELVPGVVKKVHQPDEQTLVLRIFTRGTERRFIISTDPKFCRLHLTASRPENPAVPKRFCALLRARLTGARVTEVRHLAGERIVNIGFEKSGLEGSKVAYTLVAELTGKSANAILIDSNSIVLDALRYFQPEQSAQGGGRMVFPGTKLYALKQRPQAAVQEKGAQVERLEHESWNTATDRYYTALVEQNIEEAERSRLRRLILRARKKAARKVENLRADREAALKGGEFTRFGELLLANRVHIKKGAKEVGATDYTVVPSVRVTVALDEKLGPQENIERYFKRARKAKRALKLLEVRLPEAEQSVEHFGSLLYGLATAVTKEALGEFVQQLIKTGFLKAKKREKGGVKRERPRLGADTSNEIYIKTVPEVSKKMSSEKLSEVCLKEREGAGKRVTKESGFGGQKPEPFRRYTSSEGFAVLCGKSGAGNDRLVKKEAAQEDIWFHAQGVPGSHVIIKVAGRGKELTRLTLEEAAALAAFYSKAKESGLVEVIYTEAKNVKKPRGAKPGSVTVRTHKSLKVRPKEMNG